MLDLCFGAEPRQAQQHCVLTRAWRSSATSVCTAIPSCAFVLHAAARQERSSARSSKVPVLLPRHRAIVIRNC